MGIRENLEQVRETVCRAAKQAGRNPDDVRLIAVSKTKPIEMVLEAAKWGMADFGENRPQELAEKFPQIENVRWHLIGQLQRNKVKYIIDKASLIHSLDTVSLAEEIEKRAAGIEKIQEVLVQVNMTGEETKSGISPENAIEFCNAVSKLSHLRVCGLMTISAASYSETENRKVFEGLRKLSEKIADEKIPGVSMEELSMGMTQDYEAAILEGATMVRVGTGIFGTRTVRL